MTLTVDFAAFGWPQWTMVSMYALVIVAAMFNHGKPKGNWDVGWSFFDAAFMGVLLTAGGFFA